MPPANSLSSTAPPSCNRSTTDTVPSICNCNSNDVELTAAEPYHSFEQQPHLIVVPDNIADISNLTNNNNNNNNSHPSHTTLPAAHSSGHRLSYSGRDSSEHSSIVPYHSKYHLHLPFSTTSLSTARFSTESDDLYNQSSFNSSSRQLDDTSQLPPNASHPYRDRSGVFSASTQTVDYSRRGIRGKISELGLKKGLETVTANLRSRLRRPLFQEQQVFDQPDSCASASNMSRPSSYILSTPNEQNMNTSNAVTLANNGDKLPAKKTSRVKAMFSKLKPKGRRGQTAAATSNTLTLVIRASESDVVCIQDDIDGQGPSMAGPPTMTENNLSGRQRDATFFEASNSKLSTGEQHRDYNQMSSTYTPSSKSTSTSAHSAVGISLSPPANKLRVAIPNSFKLNEINAASGLPSPISPGIDLQQRELHTAADSFDSMPSVVDPNTHLRVPNTQYLSINSDQVSIAQSESPLRSEFATNGDIYSDEDDNDDEEAMSLAAAAAVAASVVATASTVVAAACEPLRSNGSDSDNDVFPESSSATPSYKARELYLANRKTPFVQINGTNVVGDTSRPRPIVNADHRSANNNDWSKTVPTTATVTIATTTISDNVRQPPTVFTSTLTPGCTPPTSVANTPQLTVRTMARPAIESGLNRSLFDGNIGRILVSEHVHGRLLERGGASLVKLLDVHVVWSASPPFNPSFDIMWPFSFTGQQINQYGDLPNGDNITPESLQELRGDATIARVIHAMTLERDRRMLVAALCVRQRFVSTYDLLRLLVLRYLEPFCQLSTAEQLNSKMMTALAMIANIEMVHLANVLLVAYVNQVLVLMQFVYLILGCVTFLMTLQANLPAQLISISQILFTVINWPLLGWIWFANWMACFAPEGSTTVHSPMASPTEHSSSSNPLKATESYFARNILNIARPALSDIFMTEKGSAWLKERQSNELTALLNLKPLPLNVIEATTQNECVSPGGTQRTCYEEDPQLGEYPFDYAGTDLNQEAANNGNDPFGRPCNNSINIDLFKTKHLTALPGQLSSQALSLLSENTLIWPFIAYCPRNTSPRASRAVTLPSVLADLVWTRESGTDRLQRFVGAAPYLFHEDDIARTIVLLYLEALYMRDTSGADTTIARLRLVNLTRKWIEHRSLGSHACCLVDTLLRVVVTRDPDTATFAYPVLDKLHKKGTAAMITTSNYTGEAANQSSQQTTNTDTEQLTSISANALTPLELGAFPIRTASALAYRLLHADPEQLAARLVRLDHAQFIAIPLRDLVPPAKGQPRPVALEKHARWFDALAYNTAAAILAPDNIAHRVDVLERVIVLAGACLKHRAFNAAFALRATLSLSAIERLHSTWNMLPTSVVRIMTQLEHSCSTSDNYATYRTELRRAEGKATVPYIGLCLSDMMRLYEGSQVIPSTVTATAISQSNSLHGPSSPTSPVMAEAWMASNLIVDSDEPRLEPAHIEPNTTTATTVSTPVHGKENSGEGPMIRWQYWKRVGIQVERLRGWQHISYRNLGEATTAHNSVDHNGSCRCIATTPAAAPAVPVRPQRQRANTTPNDCIREIMAVNPNAVNDAKSSSLYRCLNNNNNSHSNNKIVAALVHFILLTYPIPMNVMHLLNGVGAG
ncbi:hypothetical protein BDF19DRAFT_411576 [Syncephalis fuscata]|nr:hypothetical protein BDF19DRAFT_411576 [Syncephalis fuscata]